MQAVDADELRAALAVFGLVEEAPAQAAAAGPEGCEADDVCDVWPENVAALNLFLSCTGQWQLQLGGMGGAHWRGASAPALAQKMVWQGVRGKAQNGLAQQYAVMEFEALAVLNAREAQAAK